MGYIKTYTHIKLNKSKQIINLDIRIDIYSRSVHNESSLGLRVRI